MGRDETYARLAKYCALAERSIFDVRLKARKLEVDALELDDYLERLSKEGFQDENRFAGAFTRDKMNYSSWGPLKVRHGLYQKQVDARIIDQAIASVDQEDWMTKLEHILTVKHGSLRHDDDAYAKLVRFGQQRGYPIDWVLTCLERLRARGRGM